MTLIMQTDTGLSKIEMIALVSDGLKTVNHPVMIVADEKYSEADEPRSEVGAYKWQKTPNSVIYTMGASDYLKDIGSDAKFEGYSTDLAQEIKRLGLTGIISLDIDGKFLSSLNQEKLDSPHRQILRILGEYILKQNAADRAAVSYQDGNHFKLDELKL